MIQSDILGYLDGVIRYWRSVRDKSVGEPHAMAEHYVDAYQSMRATVFGSILPPDNEAAPVPLCWWDADLHGTPCPRHQAPIGHCPVENRERFGTSKGGP